jgi:Hypothetical protein (DUF2513)
MHRDMDLARTILLDLEKRPYAHGWQDIEIEGHSADEISYHVRLLEQAGFIEAIDFSTLGSRHPD